LTSYYHPCFVRIRTWPFWTQSVPASPPVLAQCPVEGSWSFSPVTLCSKRASKGGPSQQPKQEEIVAVLVAVTVARVAVVVVVVAVMAQAEEVKERVKAEKEEKARARVQARVLAGRLRRRRLLHGKLP